MPMRALNPFSWTGRGGLAGHFDSLLPAAAASFAVGFPLADFDGIGFAGAFGVNLGHMWDQGPRIRGWMLQILELYEKGVVQPKVDKTFSFDEAAAAHHYIQDRKNIGKVLLTP